MMPTDAVHGQLPPADWYATDVPFRDDIAISTLLFEAAEKHPGQPALIVGPPADPRVCLDYAGLAAEVRRLARMLRGNGLRIGDHVVVVGHHTPATVVGILGCLVAGLTYVPVDPRWPVARRREVIAAVDTTTVLAAPSDTGWLAATDGVTDVVTLFADPGREDWRDATAALWDSVARAADPAEAAGFNLHGPAVTADEVEHYAAHVAQLVTEGAPLTVAEIGFGSGLVLRRLAGGTSGIQLLSGIEPAPFAVAAAQEWAEESGLFANFTEGFADEIDHALPGSHDAVLLASVVQFFPDEGYLARVLAAVARALRPGGTAVLADVIPPGMAPAARLLEIDRGFFESLPREIWDSVEIRQRARSSWSDVLGVRYDVLLHRSEAPAPDSEPDPRDTAADGPRVHTAWDLAEVPDELPSLVPGPENSAYVIFTSGSTGAPKGVRIGHRAVVNLVQWILGKYPLGPGDVAAQVVSFCFDLSVFDVAGVLCSGAALRLLPGPLLAEPGEVARMLESEPITFWNSAPAALGWVLPFVRPGRGRLRTVFLSGDWIPLSMPDDVRAFAPGAQLVSFGGATETTVWSNDFIIGAVDPSWPSIPYGRPMPNSRYYVLDAGLAPAPIGAEGDLFIAGTCLAEGYHSDPKRTAAAFVPDPLAGHERRNRTGDRMYRTGDRARWRPDGELEFLGRRDNQVKIRGFRVELEEIEAIITRQPGVRAAAVVAVPAGGDRQLAGFYTAADSGPEPDAVRSVCAERLPPYCVPALLRRLDAMPVTANGKIDRRALVDRAAGYIAAQWT